MCSIIQRNNYLSTITLKTYDNNKRRHPKAGSVTKLYEIQTNSDKSTLVNDILDEFKLLKEITSTGSAFHEAITRELRTKQVKTGIKLLNLSA